MVAPRPLEPPALSIAGSSGPSRPNFLLLMPDQWRWDWDGAHEAELRTPNLEGLRTNGTGFPFGATVPSPLCAPSRACMASLREYDDAGVADNYANDYRVSEMPTYYSALQAAGYHTMTAGKDDLTKFTRLGWRLGKSTHDAAKTYLAKELGFTDSRRFLGKIEVLSKYPEPTDPFGWYLHSRSVTLSNGKAVNAFTVHAACLGWKDVDPALCEDASATPQQLYQDDWTAAQAVELLQSAPAAKPWFLTVSFPGPHDPFEVTAAMASSVSGRKWPPSVDPTRREAPKHGGQPSSKRSRSNYAAEIENLDRLFGVVLDAMRARGHSTDTDTVVCVLSDHGEMLGDHGGKDKKKPWQGSLNVPLVCAGPGIRRGASLRLPVASLDLGATILDLAGAKPAAGVAARSFRGLLEGANPASRNRTVVLSGLQESDGFASDGRLNRTDELLREPSSTKEQEFSWRAAVMGDAASGAIYKYVCCKGECPDAPSIVDKPDADGYTRVLFDTASDPYDMVDLKHELPHVAAKLQEALPRRHGFDCTGGEVVV